MRIGDDRLALGMPLCLGDNGYGFVVEAALISVLESIERRVNISS